MIKYVGRTSTALLGAAIACLSLAGPAQAAAKPGWRVAEVYGNGVTAVYPLAQSALAAPAADSAWAIFSSSAVHWNGSRWARIAPSAIYGLHPRYVAASSASDAWLFGPFGNSTTLGAVHWNGARWSKAALPGWLVYRGQPTLGPVAVYLADFSPGDLWVFSVATTGQKVNYAARYLNGKWTKSVLPDVPFDVSAWSARDIWALGRAPDGKGPMLAMHWNGRRWNTARIPGQKVPGTPLELAVTGQTSLWAAWFPTKPTSREYLLHFNGKSWSKVSLPPGDSTVILAGDGHGGLWASGSGPSPQFTQLFMHWSANRWATQGVPGTSGLQAGSISELALVPGTRSLWATGNLSGGTDGNSRGAIWRYSS